MQNPNMPLHINTDEQAMRRALMVAKSAAAKGEVPVGAVLLCGDAIFTAHNQPIRTNDPSAHAEILALRRAAKRLGNYRLPGARLFVTLEPCAMCAMALIHARVAEVIYATRDPKTGACGSVLDLPALKNLNHQTRFRLGPGAWGEESAALLRDFFAQRRHLHFAPSPSPNTPPHVALNLFQKNLRQPQ